MKRKNPRRTSGMTPAVWARAVFLGAICAPGSATLAFDPLNGDYTREDPRDIRLVTYNHGGYFISSPSRDAAFNRILTALDPDIICFQEFSSSVSASQIASRLNGILPVGGAGWQVHLGLLGGTRNVIASRFPLSLTRTDTIPASSTRGVTIGLADLPDADYPVDVYLMGVHLKCCGDPGGSEDASRQRSADAIANWLGDARGAVRPSGNNITLPADTPIVNLGDFNLVGGPQPENTLLTGDIQNEGTFGPDVQGDWDISDMTDLGPVDPFTGDNFTWQGNSSFPPSRLDRLFYTDSVVFVAHSFVLNSDTMTPAALAAAGLQSGDTLPQNASDHLPIAMDLRLAVVPQCAGNDDCNDGVSCNGAETCDADGQCHAGTAVSCDDGIPCTADACNELAGACDHVPQDAECDDGLFCTGGEVCDSVQGCLPGAPPCSLSGWCDEAAAQCVPLGDGDFEPDGDVDLADAAALQRCFGTAATECRPANLTGTDGQVDLADYAAFAPLITGP